jgi:hypothetical protein
MNVYFSANTFSILGASSFVTGVAPVMCSGSDCASIFLPGGVEIARLSNGNLNATLLNGTGLSNAPAILINNAPGLQIEFSQVPSDFSYNASDCATYGEQRGQGLHLCVGSRNKTLYAGQMFVFCY